MTSDDLLRELARVAREEDDEAAWERLARGELGPDERVALEAEARRDPETAAKLEAYRPLDEAVKARIAAQIAPRPAARSRAPVQPIAPWRRAAFVALPLAAAAAAVLWMARPTDAPNAIVASNDAPAVDFVLEARGGDRAQRGAPAGATVGAPLELHADSRLELLLRPSRRAPEGIVVRAALVQGGVARLWEPPMNRSEDGAVRVAGTAGALLGSDAAGTWTLAFAIGRADAVPNDPSAIAAPHETDAAGRAWQRLATEVRIVDAK